MEPRVLFTSSNIRIETTLTDREAYEICRRITNNTFVSSLVRQFNSRGLTNRQIPYLHLEALRQLEREREAAASRGGPNVPHDVPAPVETPAPVEVQTRNGFAVNRPETVPTTRQRRRRRTQSTNDAPRIVIPSEGNLGRLFKLEYDIPLGEDRTPVFPRALCGWFRRIGFPTLSFKRCGRLVVSSGISRSICPRLRRFGNTSFTI
jgi:hypothetical protein